MRNCDSASVTRSKLRCDSLWQLDLTLRTEARRVRLCPPLMRFLQDYVRERCQHINMHMAGPEL